MEVKSVWYFVFIRGNSFVYCECRFLRSGTKDPSYAMCVTSAPAVESSTSKIIHFFFLISFGSNHKFLNENTKIADSAAGNKIGMDQFKKESVSKNSVNLANQIPPSILLLFFLFKITKKSPFHSAKKKHDLPEHRVRLEYFIFATFLSISHKKTKTFYDFYFRSREVG